MLGEVSDPLVYMLILPPSALTTVASVALRARLYQPQPTCNKKATWGGFLRTEKLYARARVFV